MPKTGSICVDAKWHTYGTRAHLLFSNCFRCFFRCVDIKNILTHAPRKWKHSRGSQPAIAPDVIDACLAMLFEERLAWSWQTKHGDAQWPGSKQKHPPNTLERHLRRIHSNARRIHSNGPPNTLERPPNTLERLPNTLE